VLFPVRWQLDSTKGFPEISARGGQQQTAKNGDWVVALVDDGVTIKELSISENAVILKPRSTNKEHKPIILDRDFKIQGVIVTVIPDFGENRHI